MIISDSEFLYSLKDKIHPDWVKFINVETIILLRQIEQKIFNESKNVTPIKENVLRFLTLPLKKAKVIILGQDPYPQEGVATGRAFEVGKLSSWTDTFRNVSLKNIIRAIHSAYHNKVLTYKEILSSENHNIAPPYKIFKEWEKQGVILLNTSFTCQTNQPNSHKKIWEPFTQKLLKFINTENPDLIWFIWGNEAKQRIIDIDIKHPLVTTHPMMCIRDRQDDFLYGKINVFLETMKLVNWKGI